MDLESIKKQWAEFISQHNLFLDPLASYLSRSIQNDPIIEILGNKSKYNELANREIGKNPKKDSKLVSSELDKVQSKLLQINKMTYPNDLFRVTLTDNVEAFVKVQCPSILMAVYAFDTTQIKPLMVIESKTMDFGGTPFGKTDQISFPTRVNEIQENDLNLEAIVVSSIAQILNVDKEKASKTTTLKDVLKNYIDMIDSDSNDFISKYNLDDEIKKGLRKLVNRPMMSWPKESDMFKLASKLDNIGLYTKIKEDLVKERPFILHRINRGEIFYFTGETLIPEKIESPDYYSSYRFESEEDAKNTNKAFNDIYEIGKTH